MTPGQSLAEVVREHIVATLAHHNGNRTHAARALRISLRTLRNKLVIYRDRPVQVSVDSQHVTG